MNSKYADCWPLETLQQVPSLTQSLRQWPLGVGLSEGYLKVASVSPRSSSSGVQLGNGVAEGTGSASR